MSSGGRLRPADRTSPPGRRRRRMQAANNLNQLIIDDRLQNQNPDPIVFGGGGKPITAANPLRGGDTTTGATGVMTYTWARQCRIAGNAYRLRRGALAADRRSSRPTRARRRARGRRVAEDRRLQRPQLLPDARRRQDGLRACRRKQECRGAETAVEYQRQHAKLIAALDKTRRRRARVRSSSRTARASNRSPPSSPGSTRSTAPARTTTLDTGNIGTDTIRVGIIYKPASVSPSARTRSSTRRVDPGSTTTSTVRARPVVRREARPARC